MYETKRGSGVSLQILGWCLAFITAAIFIAPFLWDNAELVSK